VVTNAHGDALDMKKSVAGLGRYIDVFVSSHEFGIPKEQQAFWSSAQERLGFDPQQTLFIDDSAPVLDAARSYGIRGILAVNRPDSQRPARTVDGHASVEALGHLA
jgi:putative hydrolase of the HAD superfamily